MTAARKLSPEVAAMHDDLLTRSPTYRLIEVIRRAGRPVTVAEVADGAGVPRWRAHELLAVQARRGRVTADDARPPRYAYVDAPASPAPRTHTTALAAMPTHDRAGRRVLMVLGRAPRRTDCAHYEACVDIAAHVTAGDARCPTDRASYQRRETPRADPWAGAGHDSTTYATGIR